MEKVSLVVMAEHSNTRLDLFLVHHLRSESRVTIQKMIQDKLVTVNGQPSKASHKLKHGEVVELSIPPKHSVEEKIRTWNYPLQFLYEDEHLLAVNKPAHVTTHPGAGNRHHTVANAVLYHRPEIAEVGHPSRPGIVHRLDKETSGLLLIAKTQGSYFRLSALFKDRKIEKHYRSLAFGKFEQKEGTIDRAIGRDPRNRQKISVLAKHSRTAVTHYRVLKQYDFAAELDVRIFTGRTHQIRVHLSSIHHPIIGDSKYGGGTWNRIPDVELRLRWKEGGFFGLHAHSLDFSHPITMAPMHLEAALPPLWNLL